MPIGTLGPLLIGQTGAQMEPRLTGSVAQESTSRSFASVLGEKLSQLDQLQRRADSLTLESLQGNDVDTATVMLAAEEANLALQLAVQIRNKLIEAYQEIARMQI